MEGRGLGQGPSFLGLTFSPIRKAGGTRLRGAPLTGLRVELALRLAVPKHFRLGGSGVRPELALPP